MVLALIKEPGIGNRWWRDGAGSERSGAWKVLSKGAPTMHPRLPALVPPMYAASSGRVMVLHSACDMLTHVVCVPVSKPTLSSLSDSWLSPSNPAQ